MAAQHAGGRWAATALAAAWALLGSTSIALGDTVVLKNGLTYRGTVDKDKPLIWVYDGLKRVVLRDSKVTRIDSDASLKNFQIFPVDQPLVVHGGAMPKEVISVTAGPWNDRGRRTFAFEGSRAGKVVRMEQAINELGPYLVKIRGVDGFWLSTLATSQVPREVVLGMLAKVDQHDKNERIRVARFLIQSGWYTESRAELDRILSDFRDDADLKERVTLAKSSLGQLEATQARSDIDRLRASRQPREAAARLKTFPTKDVAPDLETQIRELQRLEESQAAADKALGDDLKAAAGTLNKNQQSQIKAPLLEALKALGEAPDAVRDRFLAWQKARAADPKLSEARQVALALSGYVVGQDAAIDDLETTQTLWSMRDQVRDYLASQGPAEREEILSKLEALSLPGTDGQPLAVKKVDTITRLAVRMPPPLHSDNDMKAAAGAKTVRVKGDQNEEPTEYAVSLPPEYHPLRAYPTIVALHDGTGPKAAIAWWAAEASRRGFIVIAPEYRLPDQGKEYGYSESEHAAVELAIRDAKRRFAVDSDRVFVAGQLTGANMAWDFGLAHPDLFAGVVVISGLPFKYVNKYLEHNAEKVPMYVALGDLAPAANEVVFGQILKPLVLKAWDVTYLEYFRRGLEDLPEEAPAAVEWMEKRRRDPSPKSFEVESARPYDNRFYGIVVREFQQGRTMAPAAVEGFGKNLRPATIKLDSSKLSNLLRIKTSGVSRFDVWVSPTLIDFKKKMEVRVNDKPRYKGQTKPELAPVLEDLRIRGDRQQIYWMKVSIG